MITETPLDTIGFRLGTQELLYVLDVLKLKTLPSLGSDPLNGISAEQKQQILAAGFNSLRAREWVKITDDPAHPVAMDSLFVSTLLICASARKMMAITKQHWGQTGTAQIFFFQTPDALVSHRIPEPGVHEFIMTSARDKLAQGTFDSLELAGIAQAANNTAFLLPANAVKNFIDALTSHEMPKLEKILAEIESAKPYRTALLDCVNTLKQTTIMMFVDFPEKMTSADQMTGKTITILNSEKTAWKIESVNNKTGILLSQIDSVQIEKLIRDWVNSTTNLAS